MESVTARRPVPIQDWELLKNTFPSEAKLVLRDAKMGRIPSCGIVYWNLTLARVLAQNKPITPFPTYEQVRGYPGDNGWNIVDALEYLGFNFEDALDLSHK